MSEIKDNIGRLATPKEGNKRAFIIGGAYSRSDYMLISTIPVSKLKGIGLSFYPLTETLISHYSHEDSITISTQLKVGMSIKWVSVDDVKVVEDYLKRV